MKKRELFADVGVWLWLSVWLMFQSAVWNKQTDFHPLMIAGLFLAGALAAAILIVRQWQAVRAYRHNLLLGLMAMVLSIVVGFLFFGKGLLYDDEGLFLSGGDTVAVILGLLMALVYVVFSMHLLLVARAYTTRYGRNAGRMVWLHAILLFAFQAAILSIYVIGLAPGSMSYDTYNQVCQLQGIIPYNTWHPIGHTLFLGMLLKIVPDFTLVALVQVFFYIAVVTAFGCWLIKHRVSWVAVYAVIVLLSVLPTTGVNVMTIWKDIPFSVGLLWATLLLLKMCFDDHFFASWGNTVSYILCMLVVCLFRFNGLLAFICMLLYGLVYVLRRKDKRQRISYVTSTAIILLVVYTVNFAVPSALEANENPAGMKLRTMFQGYGAVYVEDREDIFSDAQRQQIQSVATPEEMRTHYDPYFADIMSSNVDDFLANLSKISTGDAISLYVHALQQVPHIILGDKFNLAITMWSVTPDPFSYDNAYTTAIEEKMIEVFHVKRTENVWFERIDQVSFKTAHEWWLGQTLLWRSGWALAVLFMVLGVLIACHDRRVLIYIPVVTNALVVFLTMPAQDFRYLWFLVLICPFIVLASVVPLKPTPDEEL